MGGEKDIGWFEIAMHDTAGMQRRERRQDAQTNRHGLRDGERTLAHQIGQRSTLQEFHGDEQLAAILANFINLADVGMVDARGGARFAPEALARRLVVGKRRHRFQGNRALEPIVAGLVHDAHPAFAEFACDGVVPDAFGQSFSRRVDGNARRGRRSRPWLDQPLVQ